MQAARAAECAGVVFTRSAAQHEVAERLVGDAARRSDERARPEDVQYYLSRTKLGAVPLTPLQATRVNAHLSSGSALRFLSPRQRGFARTVEANPERAWPSRIGVELVEAWRLFERDLEGLR